MRDKTMGPWDSCFLILLQYYIWNTTNIPVPSCFTCSTHVSVREGRKGRRKRRKKEENGRTEERKNREQSVAPPQLELLSALYSFLGLGNKTHLFLEEYHTRKL